MKKLLLLLLLAGPAYGQDPTVVITMEPVEVETITCRFNSWTLSGAGTATVELRGIAAQADATPAGIVTAGPTLASNNVSVTLTPDYGCGASGCRAGNWYQVRLKPTGTGVAPTCNFLVHVEERYLPLP